MVEHLSTLEDETMNELGEEAEIDDVFIDENV